MHFPMNNMMQFHEGCISFISLSMSDFEYVSEDEWGVHYNHLTCSVCQSLAVLPVRLQHRTGRPGIKRLCNHQSSEDCGTVTCLECYRHWAHISKDENNIHCPRCRRPCPKPAESMASPDCLLMRLVAPSENQPGSPMFLSSQSALHPLP